MEPMSAKTTMENARKLPLWVKPRAKWGCVLLVSDQRSHSNLTKRTDELSESCTGHLQVNCHHRKAFVLLCSVQADTLTKSTCVLWAGPSPGLCLFPHQVDCSRYPNTTSEEGKVALLCTKDISPVCGTDWVTYDNECLLCARNLWVLSTGLGSWSCSLGLQDFHQGLFSEVLGLWLSSFPPD